MEKRFFEEFEKANFEDWQKEVEKVLKGKPFDNLFSKTLDNITIKPLYSKEDIPNLSKNELPGLPNFVRSFKIDGNRLQPWKIIQRINTPHPKNANILIQNEIKFGSDGFVISHFNYDLEKPCGIVIDSITDFEELFDNLDFSKISFHFETNFPVEFLSFFLAYLEKNSIPSDKLVGSINNTLLKNLLAEGKFLETGNISENFMFPIFDICKKYLPNFKSVVIDGTFFYESGANTVQELAFILSSAVESLKIFSQKESNIEEVLSKVLFKVSIGSDIFLNLAKLRALRLLWSTVLDFLNLNTNKLYFPIYAVTTLRNKSNLDVFVNMLRNTCETFTAILGTADYIEVTPYDFFSNDANEFSLRNARNTNLVLKEEHNLCEVIDPAGGSWFLEALTFELAQKALELFKEIERSGGLFQNIINGSIQKFIFENKQKVLVKFAKRENILVGVNKFPNPEDKLGIPNMMKEKYDKILQEKIIDKSPKQSIRNQNVIDTSSPLEKAKMFPNIHSIVFSKEYINNALGVEKLPLFREAEEFEKLRNLSLDYKTRFGTLPKVLIIPYDKISDFRERLDFTKDFFNVGGFEVTTSDSISLIEDAFNVFSEKNPNIIVFCAKNDKYPEFVPRLASLIKKAKPLTITVLAGLPSSEEIELYRNNGVDEFIHIKSDIVEVLNKFYLLLLGGR
ncbi:MAG: methylmalonyl-CoA mutase family protein [Ignavibacteria bacterium]|nr:methylmalonyl-CoA mutase family protein [Ignavibacteria bacterium]